jgi:Reverse transcriptase (RNA-dependent DNA polymerase)
MCQGFFNIPIKEHFKRFTAFRCFKGLFEFSVLGMGLRTASQTQQRLIDSILRTAEDYAAPYVDDVIIYSDSWKLHLNHINDVLRRIYDARLTMKASKCQWALKRLKCLGYILEDGKIKPDDTATQRCAPTIDMVGAHRLLQRHIDGPSGDNNIAAHQGTTYSCSNCYEAQP